MALTAKKVYALLKRQIKDMEAKLNHPVRYKGTVASAELLPLNPDIGDMYNIESKSIYGEAGMNVAWNGVIWDTMGAPIDMSLYIKSNELADWVKQQNKPTYTADEVGALPTDTKIPTKVSELENDKKYLTEQIQSDWNQADDTKPDYIKDKPTKMPASDVYEWAKQPQKPNYTAEEVGALPADTKIPSNTSDLNNDSEFLTEVPDTYLTKEDAKKEYQPKDNYITKTAADAAYQPVGNYLTEQKAKETYQPVGSYLTEQKAKDVYQPKGDYLESVPQATAELLGGIKASAKTANETVEAKIDPDTGKMYVPELPGSEDLSKEETAQKILEKLQELLPLIEQVASNGIASSVNGFSFLYGTDGSVTMTYTPDGSSEAETALLPTGTTQTKIAQATKEIAASLKIIAGKDEVTA